MGDKAFPSQLEEFSHLATGLEFLGMSERAVRHQEYVKAGIYATIGNAHLLAAQIAQVERHYQRHGM